MQRPDLPAHEGRPDAVLTALAVLLVALVAGLVLAPHAAGYFFLFDDFALVDTTLKGTSREFFQAAIGGFYRPVALCGVRLEALAFGWRLPEGYALVSALLHALNAFLSFGLLRRLGRRREPALLGAALFLLSPWAGETYFWVSSQFDLFAVLFSFLAIWLAFQGLDRTRPPDVLLGAVFAASLGACLSKEIAVTLPGLFLALCVCRDGRSALRSRVLVLVAAMAAASAASLALHSRVMDALGGPYGSFPSLWMRTDLAAAAWSQVRTFVLPPGAPAQGFAVAWGLSIALLAVAAVGGSPRQALSCAAGLAVSLAPVVWSAMEPGSTAGGRYLYLPGFFVAALVSLGFEAFLQAGWSPSLRKRFSPYPAVVLLAAGVAILFGQQVLWQEATSLSRSAIDQVRREKGGAQLVHVGNLPFVLREGPYVLKSYAFRLYFEKDAPRVRSEAVVLSASGQVVRSFPDPFSEYSAPSDEAAERTVTLH